MADIDKTLPNVIKQPTEIPSPDLEDTEVNLVEDQVTTDVEQTELPDGSVDVNFDPNTKMNGQGVQGPLENLADTLSESALSTICLLYTSPSPRDRTRSRMPSSA